MAKEGQMESGNARAGGKRRARSAVVALAGIVALAVAIPGGASAVVGATDLQLIKSDSADPVVDNANFTYTLRVRNLGTNDASDVTVTDTLPTSVDFVSVTPTAGSCDRQGRKVTCELGQLNADATATVTIVVQAKKTGNTSNTAEVTSPEDTSAGNNTDTESTLVQNKATGKKPKGPSCAAPTIEGTSGNDVLTGTAGPDVIRGFAGADQIFGLGGNDLICANRGADAVFAGPKADTVSGGPGRDRLIGGTGGDVLRGKAGSDRLRGQRGADRLNGGLNRDSCKGGPGNDVLRRCP
jgi:uncharacterized repeat protein (TIGR01451 family)